MMTGTANPVAEVLQGLFVIAENIAIERTPENLASLQQGLCAVFEGRYVEGAIKNEVTALLQALMVALYTQAGDAITFTETHASSSQLAVVNTALSKTFGSGKINAAKFLTSVQTLFRITTDNGDILAATAYLLPLAQQAQAQLGRNAAIRNKMRQILNSGILGVSAPRLVKLFGLQLRGGVDTPPGSPTAGAEEEVIEDIYQDMLPLLDSPLTASPARNVTDSPLREASSTGGLFSSIDTQPRPLAIETHTTPPPPAKTSGCCSGFLAWLRGSSVAESSPLLGETAPPRASSSVAGRRIPCPRCDNPRATLASAWNVLNGGNSAKGAFAWTAFYVIALLASGGAVIRTNCDKIIAYQESQSMSGDTTANCSDLLSNIGFTNLLTRFANSSSGLGDTAVGFVILFVLLGFFAILYLFTGIYRGVDVLCPRGCNCNCNCCDCCCPSHGRYHSSISTAGMEERRQ